MKTFFVSDVHLGLQVADPADRERRFAGFLRSLPEDTEAVYLLGDIWDFWYEYRDVVPKGYVRVFSALTDLMDRGVKVFFFQGNHDVWTYSYFEELGMKKLQQPALVEIAGKRFRSVIGFSAVSSTADFCKSFSACSILGSPSDSATDGHAATVSRDTRNMSSRGSRNLCISLQ